MAYAERHTISLAVDTSGDFTGYTPIVTGRVVTLIYTKGTLDNTTDIDVTTESTGQILWAQDNLTANAVMSPMQNSHLNTTGAATTDPARVPIYAANERIKVVVDEGGTSKTGTLVVVIA